MTISPAAVRRAGAGHFRIGLARADPEVVRQARIARAISLAAARPAKPLARREAAAPRCAASSVPPPSRSRTRQRAGGDGRSRRAARSGPARGAALTIAADRRQRYLEPAPACLPTLRHAHAHATLARRARGPDAPWAGSLIPAVRPLDRLAHVLSELEPLELGERDPGLPSRTGARHPRCRTGCHADLVREIGALDGSTPSPVWLRRRD
jgi:hypothetical protein